MLTYHQWDHSILGHLKEGNSLHWRHNDHNGISNHQPRSCLLNCLFRRRSKKTSKLCITGLCVGNSPGPMNSPHKGPVTRKMFPFDDVIMFTGNAENINHGLLFQLNCLKVHVSTLEFFVYFWKCNSIGAVILFSAKVLKNLISYFRMFVT